MTVLAATAWPTNAEMVEDLVRLGYLHEQWLTLDPTYGRGTWWKNWCPKSLVKHDIRFDAVDFRRLPHPDNMFQAVVFDPPYVAPGGRKTTGITEFYDRYGMAEAPATPGLLQNLINQGLREMNRVLVPGGYLMVKVMDYVSSGKLWPGTHLTLAHALGLGMAYVDRLEHIAPSPRPQPPGRRQVHARRNLSTLLVLKKPKS